MEYNNYAYAQAVHQYVASSGVVSAEASAGSLQPSRSTESPDTESHQQQPQSKGRKQANQLPLWGNENTMNLNSLILNNVLSSVYFKVNLFKLKTYHEVVDEIYYTVKHLEPWERGSRARASSGMCGGVRGVGAGGIVSSAFCLLYKLYTLKLTRKQVNGLINHTDSPYIRALGFMYLRYTQPPADLFDWYEQYLQDEEEIDVKAGGGQVMTIDQMLHLWLTKLDWFSTLFPRIPVPIQKQIEKKLDDYAKENGITFKQPTTGRDKYDAGASSERKYDRPKREYYGERRSREQDYGREGHRDKRRDRGGDSYQRKSRSRSRSSDRRRNDYGGNRERSRDRRYR